MTIEIKKVSELIVGDTISEDVKDITGRMLLKSGTVIEEKQLNTLMAWGITEISVHLDETNTIATEASDAIDPLIIEKVEAILSDRFRHANKGNELMNELIQGIRKKLIIELQ